MEMKSLTGRKVLFFRAHIEPGVTTMPKNAIHSTDMESITFHPQGLYLVTKKGEEFFVPMSNCQTIKFLPEVDK